MSKMTLVVALMLAAATPALAHQSEAEKKIRERQTALASALKAAKTPADQNDVADAFLALAEDAYGENLFDLSLKFLGEADRIAKGTKNAALSSRAAARTTEMKEVQAEYAKARAAFKTIEDGKTEDPDANLLVGKYLAMAKGDWDLGLSYLAKGSDKPIKALAEKDAADPKDAAARLALGDEWWDLGEARKDARIRRHAADWYSKAWDGLDKVARIKTRDRLKAALLNPKSGGALDMPLGWTRQGGDAKAVHLDDRYSHTGRCSMYVDYPTPRGQQYAEATVAVTPGSTYDVTGWALTEGTGSGVILVQSFGPGGVRETAGFIDLPVDRPFWTKVSLKVTVPAGVSKLAVMIVGYGPGGHAWADDVSVKKAGEDRELLNNGSFEGK